MITYNITRSLTYANCHGDNCPGNISCNRKKLLKISCYRNKYPICRYFGHLLPRLTSAVSGKFLAETIVSKIFYSTLTVSNLNPSSIELESGFSYYDNMCQLLRSVLVVFSV